jgi:aminoglycoside phosphotransferase (APT) family kinase protein
MIQLVSARAAEWLAALHERAVQERAAPHDARSLVAAAFSLADQISAPGIIDVAAELEAELTAAHDPLVASHGDFHPKNVLFDGTSLSIIDLDKLAEREASFDAGDAIGQLLIMAYYQFSSTERGALAARAFWHHYARLTGASPERTTMHIRRAIIQALAFKVALGSRALRPVPRLEDWMSLIVASNDALEPDEIIERSAGLGI